MKNTMNYNDKDFQKVAAAVIADLKANNVKCDTKDDLYAAMSRYVQVSKEDFDSLYQQVKEMEASEKESTELNEMELDSVVGGLPDFFKTGWGVVTLLVAGALIITGVGAAFGAISGALGGVGAVGASAGSAASIAEASLAGVCVTDAATGAIAGATAGAICAVPGTLIGNYMFASLCD